MRLSQATIGVADLRNMDLEGLRGLWAEYIGPPPALRSPDLLRRLLAWHLQASRLGGLDGDTRRRLGQKGHVAPTNLHVGTRLVRIWQGQRYEVLIDAEGPSFEGRRYKSLSEVARAITGTRWNGPRFFGLRAGREAA